MMKKIICFFLTAVILASAFTVVSGAAGTLLFSDNFDFGLASRNWGAGDFTWDEDNKCVQGYRSAYVIQSNYSKKYQKAWDQFYASIDIQIRGFDQLPEEVVDEHLVRIWYQDNQIDREYNDNADMNVDHYATYFFAIVIETGEVELTKSHTFRYEDENGIVQDGSINSVIATGNINDTIEVGEDAEWFNMGIRVSSGKIECYYNEQLVASSSSSEGTEKLGDFFVDAVDETVGSMYSAFVLFNHGNWIALDNFEVWTPDYDFVAEIPYGDVNSDGKVNLTDASKILQAIAGWQVKDYVEIAADANGDGSVNLSDVSRILQYVAGWDVVLGPEA